MFGALPGINKQDFLYPFYFIIVFFQSIPLTLYKVQHILASTFSTRCVVWDLRKNEPIIKVSDSTSRVRCKAVEWNPEVATQLCVASEDDQTPIIQVFSIKKRIFEYFTHLKYLDMGSSVSIFSFKNPRIPPKRSIIFSMV